MAPKAVLAALILAMSAQVRRCAADGDGINAAKAIAKGCCMHGPDDYSVALEEPVLRAASAEQLYEVLPWLQVLARPSANDKYLLVTQPNGHGIPTNEEDGSLELSRSRHEEQLLPGYTGEWNRQSTSSGEVVGATGDGTNDSPVLEAADVGHSMGITGAKVAKNAPDIVTLDDRFSSIVGAKMWGRTVYDNIRNLLYAVVLIVFIGSLGYLVLYTVGYLALGTEPPVRDVLGPMGELLDLLVFERIAHLTTGVMLELLWRFLLLLDDNASRNRMISVAPKRGHPPLGGKIIKTFMCFAMLGISDAAKPRLRNDGIELTKENLTWEGISSAVTVFGVVSCMALLGYISRAFARRYLHSCVQHRLCSWLAFLLPDDQDRGVVRWSYTSAYYTVHGTGPFIRQPDVLRQPQPHPHMV